jgi:hypothetical protein
MDLKELVLPGHRLKVLSALELPQAHLPENVRFGLLEQTRQSLTRELGDMLERFESVKAILPSGIQTDVHDYFSDVMGCLESAMQAARAVVETVGPNDGQLSARIQQVHERLQSDLKRAQSKKAEVLLALFTGETRLRMGVDQVSKRLEEFEERIDRKLDDVRSKEQVLSRAVDAKQQEVLTTAFSDRARSHKWNENVFLGLFIVSLILVGCGIYFVYRSVPERTFTPFTDFTPSNADVAIYVLHNVLVLLAVSFVAKLTLKRWNLERNLQLLYSHRVAALNQMELFTENLPPEERSRLRIQIGREMFADPVTGYLSESTADVQVAPIMPILERVIQRESRTGDKST